MTAQASAWFVEKWQSQVLHKFQSKGNRLMGTVTPPMRIEGKTMHFPVAGKGVARKMTQGDDLVPMNADRTDVELTPAAYQAPEYIYQVNLDRMTAQELDAAIMTGAWALGRKHDEIIMDALVAGDTASTFDTAGSYSSAWDLAKALTACQQLQANDVPWDGNVFAPLPSLAWNQMLTFDQFNSADFNGPDLPFARTTDRKTWNGVHWFLMEDAVFPLDGTDLDFFIYHKSAIGAGFNGESLNVRITWENIKTAWLANQWIDFASKVLLPEGCVKCKMKSDSSITVS